MSAPPSFSAFELRPGCFYAVVAPFTDFDGHNHPAGERWRYLERNFLPYDAGLTLYVEMNGQQHSIRLQCYPECQGPIADRFSDYVRQE